MAEEKFSNFLTDIIDADLAEGKVDVVHTRFPPEPNGYLHIGSAKAIFINYTIAKHYGGLFNLRFDDTNPAREGDEYVQSILQDLKWLGAEPNGGIYYGSDYFERCYEYAEQLIKEGKAYVDDLTREEMQEYRGNDAGKPSRPSPYRDRTPEENLDLFRRMRAGEFADGEKTLRAKIDLASPNMNMRDPTIYRIKHVEHHRQGDKWCIYPMYDFAHPIQDAIEGITFSLCSLEFENHRPLYEWVITNLFGKEFPKQREFARLNVTNTVMSKRYLRELVEKNIVDGWDDPRMPTLSGLRRRGYTPTSIFNFVKERRHLQGGQPCGYAPAGGRAARRAGAERPAPRGRAGACQADHRQLPRRPVRVFRPAQQPEPRRERYHHPPRGLHQGAVDREQRLL